MDFDILVLLWHQFQFWIALLEPARLPVTQAQTNGTDNIGFISSQIEQRKVVEVNIAKWKQHSTLKCLHNMNWLQVLKLHLLNGHFL